MKENLGSQTRKGLDWTKLEQKNKSAIEQGRFRSNINHEHFNLHFKKARAASDLLLNNSKSELGLQAHIDRSSLGCCQPTGRNHSSLS